ncbi:hypothetical protein MLD38_021211 [Melastoma candidum]|uniref:Uncharacterized protein n=1 Tax=Melastoma candidum TaxID=119954 RepID=A0ACB9QF92_9MYRT|nr:hypothetical protein MLD38_021211 [Melastoma candidum]
MILDFYRRGTCIVHYLFFPVIERAYLFQGVSSNFLLQLVSEVDAEYFPSKEDVLLQNEAPTDLYILVSGTAADDLVSVFIRDALELG